MANAIKKSGAALVDQLMKGMSGEKMKALLI